MIRKLSIVVLAAVGLSGCVSSGYGYRGGSGGGDYYYGGGSSYGAPYGYGGVGYGYGYRDPYYSYGGYGYPYYGYAPVYPYPRPGHGGSNDQPRRAVVPNKRIGGIDYPPGATVFPNKPADLSQRRPTRVVGGDPTARRSLNPKLDGGPRTRIAPPVSESAPSPTTIRGSGERGSRMSAPMTRPSAAPRDGSGARNRIRDARP